MISDVSALAQESWRDADLALAKAYSECARARRALATQARPRAGEATKSSLAAHEALVLAMQELESALRLRGLVPFGKIGSVALYDPAHHALERGRAGAGSSVRVVAPGVMRSVGGALLKACVRQVKSRKLLGEP